MTTDERIDRLTERHEALTQTVEMLTQDIRELKGRGPELAPHRRNSRNPHLSPRRKWGRVEAVKFSPGWPGVLTQNRARMISGVNYQPGPTCLFLAADSTVWCNERSPKAQT
jgi:anti-sigma factor RsiW